MRSHSPSNLLCASAASFLLLATGCSNGNDDAEVAIVVNNLVAPNPMFIVSCSLGCGGGSPTTPVGCSLTDISPNAEIWIRFSERVDASSLSASSFQVVDVSTGVVAGGAFLVDPADAATVIFRPSLTFDSQGNPVFGFAPNQVYQLVLPGTNLFPAGPFIRSTGGSDNSSTMNCTVITSQPPVDPVPGAPTMTAFVTDVLDPVTGQVTYDPQTHDPVGGVALDGASNIGVESRIVLVFDDIMNPATLANPMDGHSSTIGVMVDLDGDLLTVTDQLVQPGKWAVEVDLHALTRTTAVFTPLGDQFPGGGTNPASPRLIAMNVSAQVQDLVANPLTNWGSSSFSTVLNVANEQLLSEDFQFNSNEDADASGADWSRGKLTFGKGGGSGRLGALRLGPGDVLVLNTDTQTFPLPGQNYSIMSNLDPGTGPGQYDPLVPSGWPTVTVDRGGEGFEFSELQIDPTARLVLTGSRPARVFVRGTLVNEGVVDLTGTTPEPHISNLGGQHPSNNADFLSSAAGGPGGLGGPGAGSGGQGADRMDMTLAPGTVMYNIGGLDYPGAQNVGRAGEGVGGLSDATGGLGGVNYPPTLPLNNSYFNPLFGDAEVSDVATGQSCRVAMVAGTGSGGAYALAGGDGVAQSPFSPAFPNLLPNEPAPTVGGDNSPLNLEAPGSAPSPANKRNLEFWKRRLRGGSGGGGGGTSIYASRNNNSTGPGCNTGGWGLFPFWDHSAAGGGGGGGALMLVAGRKMSLLGVLDCSGGDGGSSTVPGAAITLCTQSGVFTGPDPNCEKYAAPGGAGAGGALRLQSPVIELAVQPARINVSGGLGGLGAGQSRGGDGSPGLVRMEYTGFFNQAADAAQFAPSIEPSLPGDAGFNTPFTSAAILSIGEWWKQDNRPESYSGSQSCWMFPQGVFFNVDYVDDIAGAPDDLSRFGWNMDIVFDVPGVGRRIFPYRGFPPVDPNDEYDEANYPSALLGGVDFEAYFGTTLNHDETSLSSGSLLVVRFQGVRNNGAPTSPCDVDLDNGVIPGSLTPFVGHPAMLNGFFPAPNLIRFAVVFDEVLAKFDPLVAGRVLGITNFRMRVVPN